MKILTKAEEELMHGIWDLKRCTVSQLIEHIYLNEKPPHSSVSTIVRVLEKKGFLGHKAYGRTYEYFPLVDKTTYTKQSLEKLKKDYFGGSVSQLVSFLVKQDDLDLKTLTTLISKLEEE